MKPLPPGAKWLIFVAGVVGAILLMRWAYRRWPRWSIGGGLALLAMFSPISVDLALLGLTLPIPPDPGTPADAIVFVGRPAYIDQGMRISLAEELWRAQRAPLIFSSGAGTLIEKIQYHGVPVSALGAEICSLTTNENAVYSARSLQPAGVKRIVLITDPPHMWRSLLTFKEQGFEVIPHPTRLSPDLGYRAKLALVLREYGGLLSYALLGRF